MTEKKRLEFRFAVGSNEYIKIEFESDIEIHEEYVESDCNGFVSPVTEIEEWKITRTEKVKGEINSTVSIFFEGDESIRDFQYDINENGFIQWVGQGTYFKKNNQEIDFNIGEDAQS